MSTTLTERPRTEKAITAELRRKFTEAKALQAKRDSGDASDEEIATYKTLASECKALREELEGFDRGTDVDEDITSLSGWLAQPRTPPPPASGVQSRGNGDAKGKVEAGESELDRYMVAGPFKSLGHFMYCVHKAGPQPGLVKDGALGDWNYRIQQHDLSVKAAMPEVKAASGMNEMLDAEGGALVPPQFSNRIWERVAGDSTNLLNLVDRTPVSGNGFSMGAWNDKTRTGDILYGGARAYWGAEGAQKTSSAPATRMITWRLKKLYVLMYATDELLEDTVALESKLANIAGSCFVYKINQAIIRGTGASQPLGLLSSPAKIETTVASGQGSATISGADIVNMWSRRPPGASGRMVWLYNIDCETQLAQLNFTVAGTNSIAAQWMYLPPGGLRDTVEPRLMGRPMFESEHCSALGTVGDLILWDPQSYGAIVKSTGIQSAVSMHLRFDYDETAFRWVFRMDGRPYWDDVLTPANGNTKAPIVVMETARS